MSLSEDGTLAYLDTGHVRGQRLAWRDRAGKILEQAGQTHESIDIVSLSPDGSRAIVVASDGANRAFWLYDLRRFGRTRFEVGSESEGAKPLFAFFSRSRDEIYCSLQKSLTDSVIFVKAADGFGKALPVPAPKGFKVALDRTADGRYTGYDVLKGGVAGRANPSIWSNPSAASPSLSFDSSRTGSRGSAAPQASPRRRMTASSSTPIATLR
jgi:hypothetical protein